MFSNYLSNFEMEPALPDLLPEGLLLNDLLDIDTTVPTFPNADLVTLNQRFDQLSLDTNTQSLRIDVEKAKRQKLSASVRRIKKDLLSPRSEIVTLRQDVDTLRNEQNAINYYLDTEITGDSGLTFRSLSRIHQILALMIPQTTSSVNHNPELNQLVHELARTLQQFRVEYPVSYV